MTWQPDGWNDDMSEAPMDGTRVWAYWPSAISSDDGSQMETWYGRDLDGMSWEYDWGWAREDYAPTHWRYLPSPPSKQED